MSGWRLIEPEAPFRDGASNMAVDHALLEGVQAGGVPALRFYRWRPACLSFGRNQPAAGLYDEPAAAGRGISIVRRPTGGQAVLHDRELTYSVVVPAGAIGTPRETYEAINRALVRGLRRVGVEAGVFGGVGDRPARGAPPDPISARSAGDSMATPANSRDWLAPCFQTPARGEVVARGGKLVGSAQRREGRVLLQHGSILLDGDQRAVAELCHAGAGQGMPDGTATLASLLGVAPPIETLVAALVAGFEEEIGIPLAPDRLSRDEAARAEQLREHYASAAWTWRR